VAARRLSRRHEFEQRLFLFKTRPDLCLVPSRASFRPLESQPWAAMAEEVIKSPRSWLPPITADSQQVVQRARRGVRVHAHMPGARRAQARTHDTVAHPGARQIVMTKTFKGRTNTSVFGGTVRVNRLSKTDYAQIRNFLADRKSLLLHCAGHSLAWATCSMPTLTAGMCARAGFFRVQDKECRRLVMGTELESIAGTKYQTYST